MALFFNDHTQMNDMALLELKRGKVKESNRAGSAHPLVPVPLCRYITTFYVPKSIVENDELTHMSQSAGTWHQKYQTRCFGGQFGIQPVKELK